MRNQGGVYIGAILIDDEYLALQQIYHVADFIISANQFFETIVLYLRVQMFRPFVDYSYFKLMKLSDKLGDMRSVKQQYNQLIRTLLEEYNAKPSLAIQKWFERSLTGTTN